MQRIKNQSNKLMTDSRSKEFNLHFRMANDPEIQAAHRRISPIKTDSKANIIKYRRGGWTRTPPKYIKGENGLVKVILVCLFSSIFAVTLNSSHDRTLPF